MLGKHQDIRTERGAAVSGEFLDFAGDRYYAIRHVDQLAPFFISIVSNADHWLFVSSTGGLTAGRASPETALFPYITVDKIHDSTTHTGSKTMLRVQSGRELRYWEPFNREHDGRYRNTRNLYKNVLCNKLCFEEINHDLNIVFRYTWLTSDQYGFVRQCELQNLGDEPVRLDLVDGLQNILPAGTPRNAQANTSNLVDAYKWTELDEESGLAMFTLYSCITDRAEPSESLKANTVFCLGLDEPTILVSSEQLQDFRRDGELHQERQKRGVRGAYFASQFLELAPKASRQWQFVANLEQSQSRVVELIQQLRDPTAVAASITRSVNLDTDELARIMSGGDAFQAAAEENVAVHHYMNVLFNVLRGGIFHDQYNVPSEDFRRTVRLFNRDVYQRNRDRLSQLPEKLPIGELLAATRESGDLQLERLGREYLSITFGRRHGDPSRPWNNFEIRIKDQYGNGLLSYQGNWRDIFQNWEALAFSYPEFTENIIAKFVNASTMDGYNPYRITKEGIDWEVEDPDDPWSYIGYWGDHQIIYLQKLLEISRNFHPTRLAELLDRNVYCYANVPYRVKPFEELLKDPKNTVDYDEKLAALLEQRVAETGADGKLVTDSTGEVYLANLLEKLLVPLLAKLSNLVVDGGIWLNTQRPEWNDANNALVGQGLSMVTLCYMRRFVAFLRQLLSAKSGSSELSNEVSRWLTDTATAMGTIRSLLGPDRISATQRFDSLAELGEAASRYRKTIYEQGCFTGKVAVPVDRILALLDDSIATIDHCIGTSLRDDGLYETYNLMDYRQGALEIGTLYPMLEGQVAALSAGTISPEDAVSLLEALFSSDIYLARRHSFMLYPDRRLPKFLEKNRIPAEHVLSTPLLARMLAEGDERVVVRDAEGEHRFSSEFRNVSDLDARLDTLTEVYGAEVDDAREALRSLFELVFDHKSFTGRSGTMFGFEGLGSIYWHMVAKLLLAVQENFFMALDSGAGQRTSRQLGELYYRVREGIGFNKTADEYGAFPADPYSHSPKHAGARQPGMTGQVKEEILARFGELGVRVSDGIVHFQPNLLRPREFIAESRQFQYLDVDDSWQDLAVPTAGLAFTWCQVPIVYRLEDSAEPSVTVVRDNDSVQQLMQMSLSAEDSTELFRRTGRIRRLTVTLGSGMLFAE